MAHLEFNNKSDVPKSTSAPVIRSTPWDLGDEALNALADGDDEPSVDFYVGDTRETMPCAIVDLIKNDRKAAIEYIELAKKDRSTHESLERLIKTDPVIAQIVKSIRTEGVSNL